MQGTILEMIFHAGLLVKVVLLVLAFLSTLSWAIIIAKYYFLADASKESAAFMKAFEATRDPKTLVETVNTLSSSPLANIFKAVYPELGRLHRDDVKRVVRAYGTREEEKLHSYMIFLATTGSTAPFIGLLGTVWGIMDAFRGIGAAGSASLAVVAPGIAEALITTAAGLAVAIPAVMAYNSYVNWIRKLSVDIEAFSDQLQSRVQRGAHES